MDKYKRILYWSDEDNCWIVDVPELPGCMSHGDTIEDAINNSSIAVSEWIMVANEIGRTVPPAAPYPVITA